MADPKKVVKEGQWFLMSTANNKLLFMCQQNNDLKHPAKAIQKRIEDNYGGAQSKPTLQSDGELSQMPNYIDHN